MLRIILERGITGQLYVKYAQSKDSKEFQKFWLLRISYTFLVEFGVSYILNGFLEIAEKLNKKNQNEKNLKDPKKTGQLQAFRSSCQGQLISLDLHERVTVGKSC